jgi:hypothetical protein
MFVYHEEGNPSAVFAPDVMVVFGVPDHERRIYKLWDEGVAPSVVFEVSSRRTQAQDRGPKREMCARLGIHEYFLWDPRHEYLVPPLKGYELRDGAYEELEPDAGGAVVSQRLGLRLCSEGHHLELHEATTGDRLARMVDTTSAARAAQQVIRRAEERAARAEAEAEHLRDEIAQLRAERDESSIVGGDSG